MIKPLKMNKEEQTEWDNILSYNKRAKKHYRGVKRQEFFWPDGSSYFLWKKVMNVKGLWREHLTQLRREVRKEIYHKRKANGGHP